MGLFDKARAVAEAPAEDSFTLATGVAELKKQRYDLEKAYAAAETSFEKAKYKTRLDCVIERIQRSRGTDPVEAPQAVKRERAKKLNEPWNYPGPIAQAGMRAVEQPDQTFTHVTDLDFTGEGASYDDYLKVVKWGERFGWSVPQIAAHWGALCEREGKEVFTKTNLILLQERIRKITNDRNKKEKPMGLFDKKTTDTITITKDSVPVLKEASEALRKQALKDADDLVEIGKRLDAELADGTNVTLTDPFQGERKHQAYERLLDAGFTMYKDIVTREQAEEILKSRTMAILELGLIYEQFEKAKKVLEQLIGDISLVFDEPLERFMKANNPTGKKTWSLQYGDLVQRNKPESIALDTERDWDESLLQGWLKTQFEKNPELAKRLGITQKISYARDMKELATWMKEQKTPVVVPGTKRTPARENVFSIAPSLDTAKDKIKESLKEKGIR